MQAKMDNFAMMLSGQNKAKYQQELLLRLEACVTQAENARCAECPARNPTWASILVPPANASMFSALTTDGRRNRKDKKGKKILGVFICQKCSNFHIQMGRTICEVKNLRAADQCKRSANLRLPLFLLRFLTFFFALFCLEKGPTRK